jgi:hypothetical protein
MEWRTTEEKKNRKAKGGFFNIGFLAWTLDFIPVVAKYSFIDQQNGLLLLLFCNIVPTG